MSGLKLSGKWIDGLDGDTPVVVAARRVLKRRIRDTCRLIPAAAARSHEDVEFVHQLRVSTRRAAAALRLFRGWLPESKRRPLARLLRKARRAAGEARAADVLAQRFTDDAVRHAADPATADLAAALRWLVERMAERRQAAQLRVRKVHEAGTADEIRRRRKRLLQSMRTRGRAQRRSADARRAAYTLGQLAEQELPGLVEAVRQTDAADLDDIERLHELRIRAKRLRYALEILVDCLPPDFRQELYPRFERMQDMLGEINDLSEIIELIDGFARERTVGSAASQVDDAPDAAGLQRAADEYRVALRERREEFTRWWSGPDAAHLFAELERMIRRAGRGSHEAEAGQPGPARSTGGNGNPGGNGHTLAAAAAQEHAGPQAGANHVASAHWRVAAIDVGTNSIRMVVAESDPASGFRIIEDIKETTRLGSELYRNGRLSAAAIERSVRTIERMRSVAESYHVDRLRAVGTSAVREAANARDLIKLARRRAGVDIEPIDADHEARLAFSSVANAFDLEAQRCALADIGGGSTELVLCSGGVIDRICKLPLGAVRLTETFNADLGGEERFVEMRRAIDRIIAESVAEPPYTPELIVGTGGTFTSLARVSIRRGTAGHGDGRFPFAVRGYELPRGEVAFLLDWLRRMPLQDRRRVPGLSSQRAEIIVAGVCIIDRLMEYLGIELLRIHDGGIRDGLLAEMMDELGLHPEPPTQRARRRLDAVRRFAQRCRYPREHCEHVTRLALEIFDEIAAQDPDAAGLWARPQARELLQYAGILHDVGLLIDWRAHHKHGYRMISSARLPGLTRREREIIANIARYHRRGGPCRTHENFRKLGDDDQRLVRHLAGILRVADGLDREHRQSVSRVDALVEPQRVRFDVYSDDDPAVNVRYAMRKGDVFADAFHCEIEFAWQRTGAPDPTEPIVS